VADLRRNHARACSGLAAGGCLPTRRLRSRAADSGCPSEKQLETLEPERQNDITGLLISGFLSVQS